MYACFKDIPLEVRQRAFDLLAQSGEPKVEQKPKRIYFTVNDSKCCPLGAINYVYKPNLRPDNYHEFGDHWWTYSPVATFEKPFLKNYGIDVDWQDLEDFMLAFDSGLLDTLAKVADAMGVTYTPEQG